jgi:penicillin-binding protein 2
VNVTPLQVANEMAYIANKGWYITPHVVDSIDGGDKFNILEQYRTRHHPIDIPDTIFDVVHDGMQGVVDRGTGAGARLPGIVVCGKTGTVENYFRGVKQPNHSFFCAFAPRDNPKIAIMCVVENSGRFGGTYAAPIVGLMIEKYLKDSITDKGRLAKEEQLANLNLIPSRIGVELRRLDSLDHAKDSNYLIQKGFIRIIKDTLEIEDEPDTMAKDDKEKAKVQAADNEQRKKDSLLKIQRVEAILPDNKRKPEVKDTVSN